LEKIRDEIRSGKYRFHTILGQDFADELDEMIQKSPAGDNGKASGKVQASSTKKNRRNSNKKHLTDEALEPLVQQELKKRERIRRLVLLGCGLVGASCLLYFGMYEYADYKKAEDNALLNALKEKPVILVDNSQPVIHYTSDEDVEPKEVLDEYKNLLIKNKKLIGWLKIDDTNIDYPVMQTTDNKYYLEHNTNQEKDRNGSIFMDKDCDVLKPSTNFILYGHHMKSGQMFGKLDKYEDEDYGKEHRYIQFDTIYEKGTYEVMYVFRSRVYSEGDIVFKYYQFIDALSETEFDSYMQEMAQMSLYDTGVTAKYGDQLLTLSTCDEQENNGRFVVVAKKVATKE
jgi:sortase B